MIVDIFLSEEKTQKKLRKETAKMKKGKNFSRMMASVLLFALIMQLFIFSKATVLSEASYESETNLFATSSAEKAHILAEDPMLRDEYTKHFVLSDGSMLAATYSVPVHYLQDDEWKDIDNTLVTESALSDSDTDGLTNSDSGIKYKFADSSSSDRLFSMTTDDYSVAWELVADRNSVTPTVTNPEPAEGTEDEDILNNNKVISSVKYVNILDSVDIEYILRGNDVKENIIIKAEKDSYEFSFRLSVQGIVPALNSDGSIDLIKNGETVKTIPAAYMVDANGNVSTDIETTLVSEEAGTYLLTVSADENWIADAAFPVTIDPQLNDTDANTYTVTTTQLTETGGDDLGSAFCWTGHSAATDKKARFHVSVPIDYMINLDDYIISAEINLTRNALSDGKGNVVIGAYAATTYFNPSNAHYGSVNASQTASDKVYIDNSDSADTSYSVDITAIVRMWMRNEDENKGVVIEADEVAGDAYAVFDSSSGTAAPACVIRYRSAHGLSGNFPYHSTDLGNGGTAYINETTGNLVVVRDDVTCLLSGKAVNISGVYNSIMPSYFTGVDDFYATQMKSGNNWKLNIQEKISGLDAAGNSQYNEGDKLYVYVDSTGTKHYFVFESKDEQTHDITMHDLSGLGLTLVFNLYNSGSERFILTDKDGNTKKFDQHGYINEDAEKYGTAITYTYVGAEYATKCISSLTDRYGTAQITYNTNRTVASVTDRLGNGRTYSYDENGNLISVSDSKGTLAVYSYTGTNLTSVTDERNNLKVTFAYNGAHVSSAEVFDISSGADNAVRTQKTEFSFEDGMSFVTVTDYVKNEDGTTTETVTSYSNFFDEQGRQKAKIEDGVITTFEYDDGTNFFNNTKASASFDDLGNNFIEDMNGSAYAFTEYGTSENGSVSANSSVTYTGAASLGVTAETATDMYGYSKTFTVPENGTYTFRAFVKTADVTVSETADNGGAALRIINNTATAVETSEFLEGFPTSAYNNGWTLVSVSAECTAGDSMTLIAGIENATGIAFFDGLNFGKDSAQSINLLFNNGFESNLSGWTNSGFVSDSSANRTGTKSIVSSANTSEESSAHTSAYIGLDAERSFTLSGWMKGTFVRNDGTAFSGLKAKVFYTVEEDGVSEQMTAEYTVEPKTSSDGWQFVTTTFVPPQAADGQTVTIDRIDVYAISKNNFTRVYFDDISLIMNTATCGEFNDNGDILVEDDFLGDKVTYSYLTDGRLASSSDTYTRTVYSYDDEAMTRQTVTTLFNGPTTQVDRSVLKEKTSKFDRYNNLIYFKATDMQSSLSEISSYVYDSTANYLMSETDSAGNTKSYTYDNVGNKTSSTDETGKVIIYEYNSSNKLTREYTDLNKNGSFDEDEPFTEYTYNTDNVLVAVTSNDQAYSYVYDSTADKIESIRVGNSVIISYEYTADKVTKVSYANGDYENYFYNDDLTKLERIAYNSQNGTVFNIFYTYDESGKLITVTNSGSNTYYSYVYNASGDLEKVEYYLNTTSPATLLATLNSREVSADIPGQEVSFGSVKLNYSSTSEGNTSVMILRNTINENSPAEIFSMTSVKDSLERINSESIMGSASEVISRTYDYVQGEVNGVTTATEMVEKVTYNDGKTILYTYDEAGRILSISEGTTDSQDVVLKEKYTYDQLGRLKRNDSSNQNKTIVYNYDNNGNILSVAEYPYATSEQITAEPTSTVTYGYSNNEWKDMMTSYNGTQITYDTAGNPLSYRSGYSLSWLGQQLASLTDGSTTAYYKYNENGVRVSKTVNGETTDFILDGNYILAQATENEDGISYVYFMYDASGTSVGMNYLGNNYFFKKNLQGDIIEIWGTEDGTENHTFRCLVTYTYGVWGKIINTVDSTAGGYDIGTVNPFRYRGYYYDSESGLYYLQSRYYDPTTGRFINADVPMMTLLSSGNLFSYCSGDPVNKTDPRGYHAWDIEYAMKAFYHVAGKERLSDIECVIFDVNGDGVLDIEDSMLIFYNAAKKVADIRGRIRYINQHTSSKYHRRDDWGKYFEKPNTCAVTALSMSLQAMNYTNWKPSWLIDQQGGSVSIQNSYDGGKIKLERYAVENSIEERKTIKTLIDNANKSPRNFGLPLCAFREKAHWVLVCGIAGNGQYVILDPGRSDNLRLNPGQFDVIKVPVY